MKAIMAIESSNFSFEYLDRKRREEKAACLSATIGRLADQVIYRNSERLLYIASANRVDLGNRAVQDQILSLVAAKREEWVKDEEDFYFEEGIVARYGDPIDSGFSLNWS